MRFFRVLALAVSLLMSPGIVSSAPLLSRAQLLAVDTFDEPKGAAPNTSGAVTPTAAGVVANVSAAAANASKPTTPTADALPAPNGSAATVNGTDALTAPVVAAKEPTGVSGCATRADPRAEAWWAVTSKEGTACIFGVDVRDEGSHCIPEFDFGTNGWCWTSKDRSSWGSCNEGCPLYGPSKRLGDSIDDVSGTIDQLLTTLKGGAGADNVTDDSTAVTDADTSASDAESPKEPATAPKESTAAAKDAAKSATKGASKASSKDKAKAKGAAMLAARGSVQSHRNLPGSETSARRRRRSRGVQV